LVGVFGSGVVEIGRTRVIVRLGIAVVAVVNAYATSRLIDRNRLFHVDIDRRQRRVFMRLLFRGVSFPRCRCLGYSVLRSRVLWLRDSRNLRGRVLQRIHGQRSEMNGLKRR
jgi:hypothetical protein